ncbi:uncharacterized protein LOC143283115 isoform X2 [Babylonia areolata]|uniref:uncharacterized protein LOC143283115 isoform X2 n=1 Tax=Babylonia areolata TaxID=304850 RepID=UPI003FD2C770
MASYHSEMVAKKTRRDFGSFHASNVQELLELSEEDYVPPPFPFALPVFEHFQKPAVGKPLSVNPQLTFGHSFKKYHFLIEENCTFLNHGAFGAVLKEALKAAQWQEYADRQPLRFFDRELFPHLVHVTRRLARFVGCDPQDLALITNATTGINSVLRSLKFSHGDIIVCLNFTYGAVKKLLHGVCEEKGAVVKEVPITLPVSSPQQIINAVGEAVSQEGVKLAVLDHIPSNLPIILPLQQLIAVSHQHGVQVLVDGAHALGQIPLNLHSLDADYYISNAHKWFCSPKGAAFLYVRKELKSSIHPLLVSHGYGFGFSSEFLWTGLHDYSPILAVHTVLDFWEAVDVHRARSHMYSMAKYAGNHLSAKWGTGLAATGTMFGAMTLVELPKALYPEEAAVTYAIAEHIQNRLYNEFNIEVPVKALQGRLYVRVSLHLHTSTDDVGMLEKAVTHMAATPPAYPHHHSP